MIQGYQYNPHSSIPKALRDFIQGQGRSLDDATSIEVRECAKWEEYFAHQLGHTPEKTRRFLIEFTDGLGYDGFIALLDEDSWVLRYIQIFQRVGWEEI